MLVSPEAMRGKQLFMLGSTGFLAWPNVALLAVSLSITLPLAWRFARALDALVLGESSAASLGLDLPRLRLLLVTLMALCTGSAVAQSGLVAFVGLVAPHLVRRLVVVSHGPLLLLSALAGAVLLLAADVAARSVIAPQELPVGYVAMGELLKIVPNPGSYVSESDFFEHSWQQSFWGPNYARLVAVKQMYDPAGLFFVHQGVGSEEWSADGFVRLAGRRQ